MCEMKEVNATIFNNKDAITGTFDPAFKKTTYNPNVSNNRKIAECLCLEGSKN